MAEKKVYRIHLFEFISVYIKVIGENAIQYFSTTTTIIRYVPDRTHPIQYIFWRTIPACSLFVHLRFLPEEPSRWHRTDPVHLNFSTSFSNVRFVGGGLLNSSWKRCNTIATLGLNDHFRMSENNAPQEMLFLAHLKPLLFTSNWNWFGN